MPCPTSVDLRQCIITWYYTCGWSRKRIARTASVSLRTVANILAVHRTYGRATRPILRLTGPHRLLDTGDLHYITSLVAARPTLFVNKIQRLLADTLQLSVSPSTVRHSLRRAMQTNKRVSREAGERDEDVRAMWRVSCSHRSYRRRDQKKWAIGNEQMVEKVE